MATSLACPQSRVLCKSHRCYNDKNRRITLGAPSIEVTLEQARLEGNTGEYLKMWD
ncbi:hypothetical protein [Hominenteromicrobium sp.]|uniref:hypothetical protein n=1 Tax=Hominenteromicrobium sp. TaxID=3073581 RepID=UPI003AF03443